MQPLALWQWPQFEELLQQDGIDTAAFYQEDFGTDYLKPTRLLLGGFTDFPNWFLLQKPQFDDQGYYSGPLEQRVAKQQLVGVSTTGFATTGTEQWPSEMCKWIATAILVKFRESSLSVLAGDGAVGPLDRKYPVSKPDGKKLSGGVGKPRQCQLPGKERQFHDGAGLTSIGRWDFEERIWSGGHFWEELRTGSLELIQCHLGHGLTLDRACFEMAVKGDAGCGIVKDEQLKDKLRKFWISLLRKYGSTQEDLDHVATGQPFFLRLMKELLAFGEDADREFLMQGEVGFPVGVLSPLPRLELLICMRNNRAGGWKMIRTCRRRYGGPITNQLDRMFSLLENTLRRSAERDLLWRRSLLKRPRTGMGTRLLSLHWQCWWKRTTMERRGLFMMRPMARRSTTASDAGTSAAAPALGRNNIFLHTTNGGRAFFLAWLGISARRTEGFLHSPQERGLLACRILENDDYIYINNVGTFGVGCASYWWGRISGAGLRLIHEMLGPSMPVELLIFADDLEALAADAGGRRGIVLAFLYLSALGFPFKWSKQRGGVRVEWIGLYSDYPSYRLGLSPRRVDG